MPVGELVNLIFSLGVPLTLIALGFFVGRVVEARHLASLTRRERLPGPVVTNLGRLPAGATAVRSDFCVGSVVIAGDYFKFFGARLKTLVGGRLGTLESLLERGRREAVLRLRDQAAACGADFVLNVRLETSMIMRSKNGQPFPAAEVVAYGTAVKLA